MTPIAHRRSGRRLAIRGLALLCLLSAPGLSCVEEEPPAGPGEKPAPVEPVRIEDLRFPSPAARETHLALRAWIEARSSGFRHLPPRVLGNFVTERWCGPGVSGPACDGGSVVGSDEPGMAYRELYTLHYPQRWPAVFGLGLELGDVPPEGDGNGIGVHFSLAEGTGTIVGEDLHVSFLARQGGAAPEAVHLGSVYAYTAVDTALHIPAPGGSRAELGRLARSPESLRETARARLDALRAEVLAAIADGRVRGFDQGPYLGDGIPPVRTPRPLTPDEAREASEKAEREIARRKAFVERHREEMHRRLREVVPVDLLVESE